MATRTDPMRFSFGAARVVCSGLLVVWRGGPGLGPSRGRGRARALPLGGDEVVQPAHLALHRVQPVPLQLQRVLVDALAVAREGVADLLQALLQPAAAPLEDAD